MTVEGIDLFVFFLQVIPRVKLFVVPWPGHLLRCHFVKLKSGAVQFLRRSKSRGRRYTWYAGVVIVLSAPRSYRLPAQTAGYTLAYLPLFSVSEPHSCLNQRSIMCAMWAGWGFEIIASMQNDVTFYCGAGTQGALAPEEEGVKQKHARCYPRLTVEEGRMAFQSNSWASLWVTRGPYFGCSVLTRLGVTRSIATRSTLMRVNLPPDQLSWDQLATRSTLTRSILLQEQLNFLCWNKGYFERLTKSCWTQKLISSKPACQAVPLQVQSPLM